MGKIELHEMKKIELDILKDVAKFCDENNIRYYLAGGTLLGAIRHKGFIPWDDDIDINMTRPDYEKFEILYNQNNNNENYKFISINTNDNHLFPFGKVYNTKTTLTESEYKYNDKSKCGIYIDIFPIDGLPNSMKEINRLCYIQNLLNNIRFYMCVAFQDKKRNFIKSFIISVYKFMQNIAVQLNLRKIIIKKIINNSKKHNFEKSDFVGYSVIGKPFAGKRISKEKYIEQIELEFEGSLFKTTKAYDEWLTLMYGDYMTPPPPENQKSNHNFKAYWKNK